MLLLLQELTDSDVLSEREEASVIVDAIVDKLVRAPLSPFPPLAACTLRGDDDAPPRLVVITRFVLGVFLATREVGPLSDGSAVPVVLCSAWSCFLPIPSGLAVKWFLLGWQ